MNQIITGYIIENSSATFMARVRDNTGAYLTQAATSTVTCKVFDLSLTDPTVGATTPPAVVSTCVYDTLQTPTLDPRWNQDAIGHTFALKIDGSYFPNGDRKYRIEAKVTPTAGNAFYILWEPEAINIFSE